MKKIFVLILGIALAYSCTTGSDENGISITTTEASSITSTSASSGGNIINNGGVDIIERGVCWSTNSNPNINSSTKTSDGTGIGAFTSNLTSLSANTIYYVRAYVTNSIGTFYGNEVSFTTQNSTALNEPGPNIADIDGNVYQTVKNCNQTWMKSNLNVSKYTDGTPIPQVTNPNQWQNLTTGAWCYHQNNTANGAVYGKLYNWYAVMGIYNAASAGNPALRKKLAPTGWHIPSDSEWTALTTCLGGAFNAGGNMKEVGILHWTSPNISASNSSGFTALPGGSIYQGVFGSLGTWGNWWSSTEIGASSARRKTITNDSSNFGGNGDPKITGNSVRCLKD